MRVVGAVLADVDEGWQQSRYFSEAKMSELYALLERRRASAAPAPTEEELEAADRAAEAIIGAAEVALEKEAA